MEAEDIQREEAGSSSNKRVLRGPIAVVLAGIALAMAIFHLYTSAFGLLDTLKHRATHLMFVLPLIFLMFPAKRNTSSTRVPFYDVIFAALGILSTGYLVLQYDAVVLRGGMPNTTDIVMGVIAIVLVIEAVRRAVAKELAIIAVIFLLYGYFGQYAPGILAHRGASISRLVDHLYLIPEGLFSVALGTASTYIVLFIILATFMERSGLGAVIKDLALSLAGRSIGGPAKVAVLASSLFGTISGSAAANVVSTGVFTIPLMKSIGYSGEFAGAVEAVASTGGQLMPPIMGAAAFIMADILGVPYTNVVKAAIIPVFLYYFGTYIQIHLRAKRLGLRGLIEEEIPDVRKTLRERGHLLIPMVVLVALLVMRYTPLYAAFYALILCVMVTFLKRETRMSLKDIIWALETGAKRTVTVSIACASVGIVIGISTLTGIGTTLGNAILSLAGGNLYICLFLVMILAIILGMGMPTVAAYIILATVAVPAICEFDVPRLAAHFFVFYFGLMANVTPPVAIPAYAAAGIAESDPSKTGLTAFRLALAGFIVPYLFMTYPQMLMIGSVSLEMVLATVSATLGVAGLGCAVEGFLVSPLRQWQRAVLTLGSLLMIIPGIVTDLAGISLVAAMWLMQVKLKSGQHAEAQ